MSLSKLPVTRYYGSKRKLIQTIWKEIEGLDLQFDSVLDIFGGSGSFGYYAKTRGKKVIYNDIFLFNCLIGKALIESKKNKLTIRDISSLLERKEDVLYKDYIERYFQDIYYTDEENREIDVIIQNIQRLPSSKRNSAYYLLFQACLMKRPYNLFHRKNLNLRTNFKGGNFGNKITWERPFLELFLRFNDELSAIVFDNEMDNVSVNYSALECPHKADLLYIDPPYFRAKDHVTYHSKYHFLEGLAHYAQIPDAIDFSKKNHEISINKSTEFEDRKEFKNDLGKLINKHKDSIIVVSYRSNGIPTIDEIVSLIREVKTEVRLINLGKYDYALTRNNADNEEVLIIGY